MIELSIKDHNLLHRNMIYDNEKFLYRKRSDGELLMTKESHILLLQKLHNETAKN